MNEFGPKYEFVAQNTRLDEDEQMELNEIRKRVGTDDVDSGTLARFHELQNKEKSELEARKAKTERKKRH